MHSLQGETFEGKTIRLINDINITANNQIGGGSTNFAPIFGENMASDEGVFLNKLKKNKERAFKGVFDGNNKTLHCNVTNGEIIGCIGNGGTVKNLKITGLFRGSIDGTIFNDNEGIIENIKIDAIIKDDRTSVCGICGVNMGTITNCEVKGSLYTNDMGCCGICGLNEGKITKCKVFAKLNSCCENMRDDGFTLPETGGIASFNKGLVSECTVESDLCNENNGKFYGAAGGLVSTNNGLIENSTFKGSIAASESGGISSGNYAIIKSCRVDAVVKGNYSAAFADHNMWGAKDYAWGEIKNENLGVIDGCEFVGKVKANILSGVGAVESYIDSPGNIPQITNCKINGTPVGRLLDKQPLDRLLLDKLLLNKQ